MEVIITNQVILYLITFLAVIAIFNFIVWTMLIFQMLKLAKFANLKSEAIGTIIDDVSDEIGDALDEWRNIKSRFSGLLTAFFTIKGIKNIIKIFK